MRIFFIMFIISSSVLRLLPRNTIYHCLIFLWCTSCNCPQKKILMRVIERGVIAARIQEQCSTFLFQLCTELTLSTLAILLARRTSYNPPMIWALKPLSRIALSQYRLLSLQHPCSFVSLLSTSVSLSVNWWDIKL